MVVGLGELLSISSAAHAADDASTICKASAKAFEDAWASGNSANLAALYPPGAQVVSNYGILDGPEEVAKTYSGLAVPGAKDVQTVSSARAVGDLAICAGDFVFQSPKMPGKLEGFWTWTLGKVGSDWKILQHGYAIILPK